MSSVKSQMVNILGFVGHKQSLMQLILLLCCDVKAAVSDTSVCVVAFQ